jgi:hypothetical protein
LHGRDAAVGAKLAAETGPLVADGGYSQNLVRYRP